MAVADYYEEGGFGMRVWVLSYSRGNGELPSGEGFLYTYDTIYGRQCMRLCIAQAFSSNEFTRYNHAITRLELPEDVYPANAALAVNKADTDANVQKWLESVPHLYMFRVAECPTDLRAEDPDLVGKLQHILRDYLTCTPSTSTVMTRIAQLLPRSEDDDRPTERQALHSLFSLYDSKQLDAVTTLHRLKLALGFDFPNMPAGADDYDNPT